MAECRDDGFVDEFVSAVSTRVSERVAVLQETLKDPGLMSALAPGKMLRTRLAAYLARAADRPDRLPALHRACAALEIIHTASLCHDDVIDNAFVRRGMPTLWRMRGPSSAILIGDILLCDAVALVAEIGEQRMLAAFLQKLQETCRAEAEHEVILRERVLDPETYLRIARGKTGPFFAFAAGIAADKEPAPAAALDAAGYAVGAAYQLADDILDVQGDGGRAGKTLHTDALRHKDTLAQHSAGGPGAARVLIDTQRRLALEALAAWPAYQQGLQLFFAQEFEPTLRGMIEGT